MAQELLATARLVATYTIAGLTHKHHAYARGLTPTGGSYNINSRALDENDIVWSDAAAGLTETLSYLLGDEAEFGDVILQELVDNTWQDLDTASPGTDHGAGDSQFGAEAIMTLRDTAFKKMRIIVMEPATVVPQHITTPGGGAANWDNFILQYTAGVTVFFGPYGWQVSRGNRYIKDPGFVSANGSINRKLRRARGV